ncbi:hypothetical protein [Cylindrospermopsis raciborskii]|nr:hypothetical protein [Cylindrospermopsis raciborskii]
MQNFLARNTGLVEYLRGGLKNAIAFMNGIVDPNIKYWWLKKDHIK